MDDRRAAHRSSRGRGPACRSSDVQAIARRIEPGVLQRLHGAGLASPVDLQGKLDLTTLRRTCGSAATAAWASSRCRGGLGGQHGRGPPRDRTPAGSRGGWALTGLLVLWDRASSRAKISQDYGNPARPARLDAQPER